MRIRENESVKYWTNVLNSLKNRGVQDILIACTDNLTGFAAAIEAVFPNIEIRDYIEKFKQVYFLQGYESAHGKSESSLCRNYRTGST